MVRSIQLPLAVLVLVTFVAAQQVESPLPGTPTMPGSLSSVDPSASQIQTTSLPDVQSYPNTAEGLEHLMNDMISLEQAGKTAELAPYLKSIALPDYDSWFASEFGTARCEESQLAANDCLGPRLAFTYRTLTRNLPASFDLTLRDLIHEKLTSFEATNYTAPCPGPSRITASPELVGGLTTTPILSPVLSGLVQHQEPVYVLWSYSEAKETTLPFFVYSQGAFRYIGMPHPASIEDFQKNKNRLDQNDGSPPEARYLTEDQLEMPQVLIDPSIVAKTVVVHVKIDNAGRVQEAAYIRGPEAYGDAAIHKARKQKFEPPGFGPRGIQPNSFCINVVPH